MKMPKILQRTLLKSIINYTGSMFLYYIVFAITNIIFRSRYNFLGDRELVLFFFILIAGFLNTAIPDYIFIAPFSRKERIQLQKKLFLYSHFATWGITSAFISFPELIMSVINRNLYDIGKYLFEITIMYFLLFVAGYSSYFNLLNKKNFTFTGIAINIIVLLESSVLAAVIIEGSSGTVIYITMAAVFIIAILSALYCYKKHFQNMLEFYSDYETSMQKKA